MRLDEIALGDAQAGKASARLYVWDGVWVTLGRSQHPAVDLVDPESTKFALRPTGGSAVLHGHDLTVALAEPLDSGCRPSVKDVYRRLAKPILAGLRECGLQALLAEDTSFVRCGIDSSDCFAGASPNDIVDEETGKKVCGCALRVTRSGALLQASLPVRAPDVDPATIIVGGREVDIKPWRYEDFPAALRAAVLDT